MKTPMPALGFLLLLAPGVLAQPLEDRSGLLGDRPRARAHTFLVLRLAEALDLPDDKTLELRAIVRGIDDRRRALRGQRLQVEDRIRGALERRAPDAELGKLVAEANEIDQQLAQVPATAFREAQKILTVAQQAKLVLVRPQMQKEVRGMIRQRLESRPGRVRRLLRGGDE